MRRLTHCQGRNAQRWPKRRRRPALDGSRKSRAHRSYRHLGRSRAPILIVNPSLGLTQASTPAVRGPLAGPASKHAAAHLGVWKAEGGAARPIADRVNGIRVSRTRTATRFNRLSVEGSALTFQGSALTFQTLPSVVFLLWRTRALSAWRERRTLDEAHCEKSLRPPEECSYGHRHIAAATVHRDFRASADRAVAAFRISAAGRWGRRNPR